MNDLDEDDLDDAPEAFTNVGECWAWRRLPSVIGGPTHTHVCRELLDDHGRHDGAHHCGCGADF